MRVIPVLDLLKGLVVRGIGGRRHEYRPIDSPLASEPAPLRVANALQDRFGFCEAYIADLDAIAGEAPAIPIFEALLNREWLLWIDAGLRQPADATALAALLPRGRAANVRWVLGLETLSSTDLLRELASQLGSVQLTISLDLRHGRPLTAIAEWQSADPREIAAHAVAAGISSLIVLDLAQVGEGRGVGTESLCADLRRDHPNLTLIAGGGVRSLHDLRRLHDAGCDAALVATALHYGQLTPEDLRVAADWR